jgi:membrane protein implicated in regulation of membrane protease activity
MSHMGRWLIVAGVVLIVLGIAAQTGVLSWFGRLPGDLRIERPGFSLYVPITSMLIVSVLLSALLYVVRRFF